MKLTEWEFYIKKTNAATFGWLCVETRVAVSKNIKTVGSHLRVAVC